MLSNARGAHHEQTSLNAIDTNLTGWAATSDIEVSQLIEAEVSS